jgi:hypothetical protein
VASTSGRRFCVQLRINVQTAVHQHKKPSREKKYM